MSDDPRPFLTVVCGVPRSGTSLLMRMLAAGGLPPLSDGVRAPDASNPLGYYELEAVKRLPEGADWVARARGRAVKVIHLLLPKLLAVAPAPSLRVILVRRRFSEVVASQNEMLARSGSASDASLAPERLAEIYEAQWQECADSCRAAPGVGLLELDFEALLAEPGEACARLDAFLGGGLDRRAMARVVDPVLVHHRVSQRTRDPGEARTNEPGAAGYPSGAMTRVPLGPLDLEIEHRMPGPAGGPTLRVRQREDGRERLRFDCFASEGHWHLDPAGRDEITVLPPGSDVLDWTIGELRRDLIGYLSRAGLDGSALSGLPDEDEREVALDRAERALRNPPSGLDDLDARRLRQRSGEKWSTYPEDVLPLWVADMDFPVADPIRRRLQRCLDVDDLGYPLHPRPTRLPELFAERASARFDWQVEPRRVELITEVVQGIYVALEQFTEPGDGVIVQTPIYPPFLSAVREMKRSLLENPLRCDESGFGVDLDDLRSQAGQGARALLLCNPHNPTGRVFRREELQGIADVALSHDLLIVSDEIHADLVYPGARHLPTAALSEEVAARTITLTSASKAFNIAGLRCAVAVFGSPELRRRFLGFPRHLRGGLGSLGIEATREAWSHGDPWLAEVIAYLEANRNFTLDFLSRELPEVRAFAPEATYLLWLDCRALELAPDPYSFFLEQARVALSAGPDFGSPGEGFVRLNFATSRAILSEALERMAKALRARTGGS